MASFLNSRLRHRSCERRFCPSAPPPSRGNTASASTSSLTGAFYAAPQCAAFPTFSRPRAAPTRSPLPPPLHRVILDANAADTNDRRITCYACNNVCRPWEIWKENRRRKGGRGGGAKRRGRENTAGERGEAAETETETGQPLPSLRFAGCSTRFIHEFHFHGHGHGHAIRVATAPRSPPLLLFSSPLLLASAPVPASRLGRPRKNKPTRTGRGETHAFPIFELARPLLCKHFQGGSRRRKRSLLASNTNTLTMNHRDHRIRPLLPVRG